MKLNSGYDSSKTIQMGRFAVDNVMDTILDYF
jgi:hypothetical protein